MVKAKETTKFDYINTVLSWSHPSLSGLLSVCVMYTFANGLKSGWRGKFKTNLPRPCRIVNILEVWCNEYVG